MGGRRSSFFTNLRSKPLAGLSIRAGTLCQRYGLASRRDVRKKTDLPSISCLPPVFVPTSGHDRAQWLADINC